MLDQSLKYGDLTAKVIGSALAVHNILKNGFQELIYQRALEIEMRNAIRADSFFAFVSHCATLSITITSKRQKPNPWPDQFKNHQTPAFLFLQKVVVHRPPDVSCYVLSGLDSKYGIKESIVGLLQKDDECKCQ